MSTPTPNGKLIDELVATMSMEEVAQKAWEIRSCLIDIWRVPSDLLENLGKLEGRFQELRHASETTAQAEHIDIVFDGPPGHESGRFVEVESPAGRSIKFGEWVKREDGYWALRFAPSANQAWIPVTEQLPDDDITVLVACKDTDEPVWMGYHDGTDGWTNVDGMPLKDMVTHWRPMPEPPHG